MTWQQFESDFCELLKAMGYWALNIPKNKTGAQPFDVIAIHGNRIYAVDCKMCSKDSFPIDRVEDNQWTAFDVVRDRTNADIGIMAYHKGDIFFLPFWVLVDCRELGVKSIKLTKRDIWMGKEDIKSMLGRYME